MLSRIPPVRSSLLVLAVFVVGAGIGALVIALSDHNTPTSIVVKRVVISAPAVSTTTTARSRPAVVSDPAATRRRPASYASTVPAGAGASFASLESRLAGSVGLAVAPLGSGPIMAFGQVRVAHAWSTSKVPVLTTLLYDDATDGRILSPQERTDAALALEQSNNAAIEALFAELEQIHGGLIPASEAVQQMLSNGGDDTTIINTAPNDQGFTTYGQTEWPVTGEVTFYRSLARGCLLDPHDTAYVLGLMRNVIGYERWGAGSAGYPSSLTVAFKGGWGPDSSGDYQVRQTAIIGSGNRGYVVSMLALPSSGTFADGTSMITALATWARQHFNIDANTPSPRCAAQP
jgi:hypothetical protein